MALVMKSPLPAVQEACQAWVSILGQGGAQREGRRGHSSGLPGSPVGQGPVEA